LAAALRLLGAIGAQDKIALGLFDRLALPTLFRRECVGRCDGYKQSRA